MDKNATKMMIYFDKLIESFIERVLIKSSPIFHNNGINKNEDIPNPQYINVLEIKAPKRPNQFVTVS